MILSTEVIGEAVITGVAVANVRVRTALRENLSSERSSQSTIRNSRERSGPSRPCMSSSKPALHSCIVGSVAGVGIQRFIARRGRSPLSFRLFT